MKVVFSYYFYCMLLYVICTDGGGATTTHCTHGYRCAVLALVVRHLYGYECVAWLSQLLARCEEELLSVEEAQRRKRRTVLEPAVRRWVQRVKEIFLQQQGEEGDSGRQHVSPEQFTLRAAQLDAALEACWKREVASADTTPLTVTKPSACKDTHHQTASPSSLTG